MGSSSDRRPSFNELAGILDRLPQLVSDARRAYQLTLAAAGSQIGVNASTLMLIVGEEPKLTEEETAEPVPPQPAEPIGWTTMLKSWARWPNV